MSDDKATKENKQSASPGGMESAGQIGVGYLIDTAMPVIHGIESAPVLNQATAKAVAVTRRTDVPEPIEQSVDLAQALLDYITTPTGHSTVRS